MPPGNSREMACVIVAGTGPERLFGRQLVPLLAGHLASLAANAKTSIGEKAHHRLWWWRWLLRSYERGYHAPQGGSIKLPCLFRVLLRTVSHHSVPPCISGAFGKFVDENQGR